MILGRPGDEEAVELAMKLADAEDAKDVALKKIAAVEGVSFQ